MLSLRTLISSAEPCLQSLSRERNSNASSHLVLEQERAENQVLYGYGHSGET
jgi:hypothetical protein